MTEIKVKEICSIAMTEEQGLLVRDTIAPFLSANEPVILDFAGISLFAAMFFNASIGYYVVKRTLNIARGTFIYAISFRWEMKLISICFQTRKK